MRVLDLAPDTQTRAFDDDLSFEFRRLTLRETYEIAAGTAIERAWTSGEGALDLTAPEVLDVAERVIERMVVGWNVVDPKGQPVPVTLEAGQRLMTDVPNLAGWLVVDVFLGIAKREAEVEQEKKH